MDGIDWSSVIRTGLIGGAIGLVLSLVYWGVRSLILFIIRSMRKK